MTDIVVNGPVGDNATIAMDGKHIWTGPMTAATPKQLSVTDTAAATASCASNMIILPHGSMLVGHDYRQTQVRSQAIKKSMIAMSHIACL